MKRSKVRPIDFMYVEIVKKRPFWKRRRQPKTPAVNVQVALDGVEFMYGAGPDGEGNLAGVAGCKMRRIGMDFKGLSKLRRAAAGQRSPQLKLVVNFQSFVWEAERCEKLTIMS